MAPPIGDNLDPTDHVLQRLSQPREAAEMPAVLFCPSKHRAYRQIVALELTVPDHPAVTHQIPVWVCPRCVTVFRFPECLLIPGDEGAA